MKAVLFLSNGHGEGAIAERIAREVHANVARLALDHFPLVGVGSSGVLRTVGPRAVMPSGGLVAMGNVRALAGDIGAGFARLFSAQVRFLFGAHAVYERVVAVGDAYALALALLTRRPVLFVGTAKSVHVAGYGPFERWLLARAERVFVRDPPTAAALCAAGIAAEAPGNVIVDLVDDGPALLGSWLGILPGSRPNAYADGVRLARVVRALAERPQPIAALFSVAPALDARKFVAQLTGDGWDCVTAAFEEPESRHPSPFIARSGDATLTGWAGSLGTFLRSSRLVLGAAGTANEAAAACGVPVVALEEERGGWYRRRQVGLLGEAMISIPGDPSAAAAELNNLLGDPARLERMGRAGRERMGPAGGAAAIAHAVLEAA